MHIAPQMLPPVFHIQEIPMDVANKALVEWNHKMGPCNRPMGLQVAHGFIHHSELVALTVTADLVAQEVCGKNRTEAVELARLCASRSDLCRVTLRLWRELLFPAFAAARGYSWAISYQDANLHTGNTYRFDGWRKLGVSRSGTDKRSGRKGRNKVIWGWELPQ